MTANKPLTPHQQDLRAFTEDYCLHRLFDLKEELYSRLRWLELHTAFDVDRCLDTMTEEYRTLHPKS